jgi:hypothetical protein
MSEKLGWFKFYPGDWSRDLEEHPAEIEGYWIRLVCKLSWEPDRGRATKTLEQWARILRVTNLDEARRVIQYLKDSGIADVDGEPILDGAKITICSRRMVRDQAELLSNNKRQADYKRRQKFKCEHSTCDGDCDKRCEKGKTPKKQKGNGGITPESQDQGLEPEKSTGRVPKLTTVLKNQSHSLFAYANWFDNALWTHYPARNGSKKGKAEAWEWVAKHKPAPAKREKIEAKLREDLASKDWQEGLGIKDCHRWLKANEKNGWESTQAAQDQGDDPYEGTDD